MPATRNRKNKPLPERIALPTAEERPTLSVPEVAVLLGISRQHAYEGVRTGDIPCLRVGRKVLVPTAQLRRLLAVDAA
jgi:excisionase family DNA binding protein